jgi:hypothetical protein
LLSISIVGTIDKLGDLVKAAVGGVTTVGGFDSSMFGTTVEVVSGDGVDGVKVSVSGVVALPDGINVGNVVMGADIGEAVTVAPVGEGVSLMAVMSDVVVLVGVDVPGWGGVGTWTGWLVGLTVTGRSDGRGVGFITGSFVVLFQW